MKKAIRLSLMTMFIFIAFTAMSFAAPADSISADTVQKLSESFNSERSVINKPKDFVLATIDDNVIISGMGKEGDRITVSLYTRSVDEYVPMTDSIDFEIGQSESSHRRFPSNIRLQNFQLSQGFPRIRL